ncbi:hypothetical protein CLOM_g3866 [Closterium sp. NIES-68]|nr:hypothetical protein CLOM_g3866 [Closterium sp. NIES-68]GJP66853.1 hypothetical protein CLOP_g23739 [Closterium sp. NIES-67]
MAFALAQKLVIPPSSVSGAFPRSPSESSHKICSPSRRDVPRRLRCSAGDPSTSSEGSSKSDLHTQREAVTASHFDSQESQNPRELQDSPVLGDSRDSGGAEAGPGVDAKQDSSRTIPRRFLLAGATLAGGGILLEGGGDRAGRPLRSNNGRRWSIQGSSNATPLPLPLQPDVDSLPGESRSLLDDRQGLWVSEAGSDARLVPVHEGLIAEKRFSESGPYDVENLYHQEHTCASCFPDCAAGGCLLRITVTYPARMRHTAWTPQYSLQEDKFPLAVFSSGFLLDSAQYRSYAEHLASWGFAVVTYNKVEGLMGPLDDIICARFITELINWAGTSHVLRRIADNTRVYLCGHSRGAKVSVLAAAMDPRVLSLGLVDPVDNTIYAPLAPGYPSAVAAMRAGTSAIEHLLADAHPANQGLALSLPTLVVGGGYPGDCAPAASNYRWFFKEAGNPSWEVVLRDAGHFQFLDSAPVLQSALCGLGGARDEDVRRATRACIAAWGHATVPRQRVGAVRGRGSGLMELQLLQQEEQARAGVGGAGVGGGGSGCISIGGSCSENGSSGSSGGSGSSDISSTDGPVADSWSVGPARAMMPAQTPAPALTPLAPLTVEDSLEAPVSDRKDELKGMVTSVAAELAALGGTKFVSRLKI